LVQDAIEAGIFNDLGSGSNVDVVVINSEKVEVLRNYGKPNERGVKEARYGAEDITLESLLLKCWTASSGTQTLTGAHNQLSIIATSFLLARPRCSSHQFANLLILRRL